MVFYRIEHPDRILKKMPKVLSQQIQEWTRTSGAVFYLLALYELPGQPGLQSVEYVIAHTTRHTG